MRVNVLKNKKGKKEKIKYFSMLMVLLMIFNLQNVDRTVDATSDMDFTCENDTDRTLSEIISNGEYYEAKTESDEWKVDKNDNYVFPIDCDSKEWKEYKTHTEMLEACTVPSELLKSATTKQLLDLVLDYPLLSDIYAFDTVEQGITIMASRFNVFKELLNREDYPDTLLNEYNKISLVKEGSEIDKINNVSAIVVLEDLLAQKEVLRQLSVKKVDSLLEEVEEKTEEKLEEDIFVENATTFYDVVTSNGMNKELGIEYYSDGEENLVRASAANITVKTPNGTKVEVLKFEYNGKEWADTLTNVEKFKYPNAKVLRKADNRYNCHSYAWYSTADTNKYWMNNPKAYVSDGSYKYVGKKPTAKNQKAVYRDQSVVPKDDWIHSAITVNKSGKLKSKWGQGPLMEHDVKYSPYEGLYSLVSYYKK